MKNPTNELAQLDIWDCTADTSKFSKCVTITKHNSDSAIQWYEVRYDRSSPELLMMNQIESALMNHTNYPESFSVHAILISGRMVVYNGVDINYIETLAESLNNLINI